MVRFLHRILQLEVCKSFHEAILVHLLHTIEVGTQNTFEFSLRVTALNIQLHLFVYRQRTRKTEFIFCER